MDESSINPYAPPRAAPGAEAPDGYAAGPKRPWPRYLARRIDMGLLALPVGFLWGVALVVLLGPERFQRIPLLVHGVVALGLTLFIEAWLLSTWGTTPGKWLWAIRLRRPDGARLGYREGLARGAAVFLRGVGLGIPLLTLLAALHGYTRLEAEGVAPWDPPDRRQVEHGTMAPWRWVLAVVLTGGVLVLDALAGIRWLS